jgi:hypothetical protein
LQREFSAVVKVQDEVLAFLAQVGVTLIKGELPPGIWPNRNNSVLSGGRAD